MRPHGSWRSLGRGKRRCVRSSIASAASWSGTSPRSGSLDEREDVLRLIEFCSDPSCRIPRLEAESRGRGARGRGLAGSVWATAKPLWLVDVQVDEDSPRLETAAKEGFRAALAVPIFLGGEVFGVMEFFSRGSRPPDEDILEMTTAIGRQIGQFIESRSAEEAPSQPRGACTCPGCRPGGHVRVGHPHRRRDLVGVGGAPLRFAARRLRRQVRELEAGRPPRRS